MSREDHPGPRRGRECRRAWCRSGRGSPLRSLPRGGDVGVEHDLTPTAAPGEAGMPVAAALGRPPSGRTVGWRSWSSELGGDPQDGFFARDQALRASMSTAARSAAAAVRLSRPRLQDIEPLAIDRELDVLDVAIVAFERFQGAAELRVRLREHVLELLERLRRPDARDDVLALGVDEELAPRDPLAACGIAREATPVAECVAGLPNTIWTTLTAVPIVVRFWFSFPIDLRARVLPGAKDGLDREHAAGRARPAETGVRARRDRCACTSRRDSSGRAR